MKQTIALIALIALTGCATHTVEIRTPVVGTNGSLVGYSTTTAKSRELFDGKNMFDKLRLSNGKTQAVGISGFEGESSGTNAVRSLELLNDIMGKLPK